MRLITLVLAALLAACGNDPSPPSGHPTHSGRADPHSFSRPEEARTRHVSLDLTVDFERRVLEGEVTLTLEGHAPQLTLDTRELVISGVNSGDAPLEWSIGDVSGALGQPLVIQTPGAVNSVTVAYRSSPGATGLQWLEPVQTAGGRHPFLFSQSQAIHARSWVPLQDTPQVRFTYDALIRTPAELRAVMSAHNDPEAEKTGTYRFQMPQAIPSYLLAIAVGDLEFRAMSDRTGVYAEAPVLESAVWEFSDTEAMMRVSEELFGPYLWGRYDLLILPPSFPFGGMENPRLSFITPTVLAGDRSLVALIAHELAHSWSGNLVTNATWDDLWLNEGFTVYLEARIMEVVFGEQRRAMEDVLGYENLVAELAELDEADQHLKLDLAGRDPDDAFSNVPYEKGRLLLVYLENAFGRETFDAYLRGYFDRFGFKSLGTAEFLADVQAHLLNPNPGVVSLADLDAWIHQPGLPPTVVVPQSNAFAAVDRQRTRWMQGEIAAAGLDTRDWTVHEWLYFVNNLRGMSAEQMAELDQAYQLTATRNNEIAHSWLLKAIANGYAPANERIEQYLRTIGRNKLIVPVYAALMDSDWGQEMARRVYAEARPTYHPLTQSRVDGIVGWVEVQE